MVIPAAAWGGEGGAPSTPFLFLRMILSLAVVLALLFGVLHGLRRFHERNPAGRSAPLLTSKARLDLGQRREIRLIEIPGRVLVLGITPDRMDLLAEMPADSELPSVATAAPIPLSRFAHRMQKLITSL
ncbi:MAG TPA: flagellar biosynthetic protein FliO [bacterium]|nr:flagellar biosynthetic protein FliO [bacterium]